MHTTRTRTHLRVGFTRPRNHPGNCLQHAAAQGFNRAPRTISTNQPAPGAPHAAAKAHNPAAVQTAKHTATHTDARQRRYVHAATITDTRIRRGSERPAGRRRNQAVGTGSARKQACGCLQHIHAAAPPGLPQRQALYTHTPVHHHRTTTPATITITLCCCQVKRAEVQIQCGTRGNCSAADALLQSQCFRQRPQLRHTHSAPQGSAGHARALAPARSTDRHVGRAALRVRTQRLPRQHPRLTPADTRVKQGADSHGAACSPPVPPASTAAVLLTAKTAHVPPAVAREKRHGGRPGTRPHGRPPGVGVDERAAETRQQHRLAPLLLQPRAAPAA